MQPTGWPGQSLADAGRHTAITTSASGWAPLVRVGDRAAGLEPWEPRLDRRQLVRDGAAHCNYNLRLRMGPLGESGGPGSRAGALGAGLEPRCGLESKAGEGL